MEINKLTNNFQWCVIADLSNFCVIAWLATLYLLASAIRNVRCCHVYVNMQIEVATTGAEHDNPYNR